jgi:hypothetical protein
MLKRLGDRASLILALSPAAIFIIIAFILIVGPRLAANSTATAPATDASVPAPTFTAAPTAAITPTNSPQPVPPTVTPETIIIRREGLVSLN